VVRKFGVEIGIRDVTHGGIAFGSSVVVSSVGEGRLATSSCNANPSDELTYLRMILAACFMTSSHEKPSVNNKPRASLLKYRQTL
jgi:hypothetical protein